MSNSNSDFSFAFNDKRFSDRVLRIEIVPDSPQSKTFYDGFTTTANWAPNQKKRRVDMGDNVFDVLVTPEELILNSRMPSREDGVDENHDEEDVTIIEESHAQKNLNQIGNEAAQSNDLSWSTDCSTILTVKSIYISSLILAEKSPFFYKLFSNGMMESEQQHVILRIDASEEAALMELLNFMYSNTLSIVTHQAMLDVLMPTLLDVLMVADKYEVTSCIKYCTKLLLNLPMSCESTLLYLQLPSSAQPLIDAAKQFLVAQYKDISKFHNVVLNFPLAGVEVLLSSDDLRVNSEDDVFDFVLEWTQKHYSNLEDRKEVISSHLSGLIRFPYMSSEKLKEVLVCNDFDPKLASKVVLDAFIFKAEAPCQKQSHADQANCVSHLYVERAYKYRPIKFLEFKLPYKHCIVYFDLKQEECAHLFPAGDLVSQVFHFGGRCFYLSANCMMDDEGSSCFGLSLVMHEKESETFAVAYEFLARSKNNKEYQSQLKGWCIFTGGKAVGSPNLFDTPWTKFVADNSTQFINGILHLKAELTINK